MSAPGGLEQWQKDGFFQAAEEVQESADLGRQRLNWVKLDDEERDDLVTFLSAPAQFYSEVVTTDNNSHIPSRQTNVPIHTNDHRDMTMVIKDIHEVSPREISSNKSEVCCLAEQLHGHKMNLNLGDDHWKIDIGSNNMFNMFLQKFNGLTDRSRSYLSSWNDNQRTSVRAGGLQIQGQQQNIQFGRSIRITLLLMLSIFLIGLLLLGGPVNKLTRPLLEFQSSSSFFVALRRLLFPLVLLTSMEHASSNMAAINPMQLPIKTWQFKVSMTLTIRDKLKEADGQD
ncbi:hypothetical protein PR202_ga27731 [Eleusine coracana subsp. coracana]|uniref:Uncharacterized protein n=1 Tax=Eleusine coracana subsp. coracana TaxID=191504 RepID=A0AAV5DHL4_ELECO|nr:hypothetical protein PR202_ga27731 [Eleusine coracana subsp. coracana]